MKSLGAITFILLVLVLISESVFALPEAELDKLYPQAVAFFNASPLQEFSGQHGAIIRYKTFVQPAPADAIVISNGYHEDMGLYSELIFDLYHRGYSIYILDHRGQGLSDRLIANRDRGYIDAFARTVLDLHTFVKAIVSKNQNKKLHLLSHSMGGAIAMSYLEKFPKDFSSAVFSAPMLRINTGKWNEVAALEYSRVKCVLGHCTDFAQEQVDPLTIPFEANEVTYSPARYQIRLGRLAHDPPGRFLAPSYGWIKEAIAGSRSARMNGEHVKIPILILQATDDTIVIDQPQNEFCKRLRNCQLISLKSKHSIFIGPDVTRSPAIEKTIEFFQSH